MFQLLLDTIYDSKNRLIFKKMTLLILVLRAYGSKLSVAVKSYFAIAIILADLNHVIQLLQCNNIELLPNPNIDAYTVTMT